MADMQQFYTREAANEGIDVPLTLPNGKKSEHSIKIRGVDSNAFKKAEIKSKRKLAEIAAIENEDEQLTALEECQFETIAALVISWTFEEKCTFENVVNLFKQAPQIAEAINIVSARRGDFLAQRSGNSVSGTNQN